MVQIFDASVSARFQGPKAKLGSKAGDLSPVVGLCLGPYTRVHLYDFES